MSGDLSNHPMFAKRQQQEQQQKQQQQVVQRPTPQSFLPSSGASSSSSSPSPSPSFSPSPSSSPTPSSSSSSSSVTPSLPSAPPTARPPLPKSGPPSGAPNLPRANTYAPTSSSSSASAAAAASGLPSVPHERVLAIQSNTRTTATPVVPTSPSDAAQVSGSSQPSGGVAAGGNASSAGGGAAGGSGAPRQGVVLRDPVELIMKATAESLKGLLESLVKNCPVTHAIVGRREVLDSIVNILPKQIRDPQHKHPFTTDHTRDVLGMERYDRILVVIQLWGKSFAYNPKYPEYQAVYKELLNNGVKFAEPDRDETAPVFTPPPNSKLLAERVAGIATAVIGKNSLRKSAGSNASSNSGSGSSSAGSSGGSSGNSSTRVTPRTSVSVGGVSSSGSNSSNGLAAPPSIYISEPDFRDPELTAAFSSVKLLLEMLDNSDIATVQTDDVANMLVKDLRSVQDRIVAKIHKPGATDRISHLLAMNDILMNTFKYYDGLCTGTMRKRNEQDELERMAAEEEEKQSANAIKPHVARANSYDMQSHDIKLIRQGGIKSPERMYSYQGSAQQPGFSYAQPLSAQPTLPSSDNQQQDRSSPQTSSPAYAANQAQLIQAFNKRKTQSDGLTQQSSSPSQPVGGSRHQYQKSGEVGEQPQQQPQPQRKSSSPLSIPRIPGPPQEVPSHQRHRSLTPTAAVPVTAPAHNNINRSAELDLLTFSDYAASNPAPAPIYQSAPVPVYQPQPYQPERYQGNEQQQQQIGEGEGEADHHVAAHGEAGDLDYKHSPAAASQGEPDHQQHNNNSQAQVYHYDYTQNPQELQYNYQQSLPAQHQQQQQQPQAHAYDDYGWDGPAEQQPPPLLSQQSRKQPSLHQQFNSLSFQ